MTNRAVDHAGAESQLTPHQHLHYRTALKTKIRKQVKSLVKTAARKTIPEEQELTSKSKSALTSGCS